MEHLCTELQAIFHQLNSTLRGKDQMIDPAQLATTWEQDTLVHSAQNAKHRKKRNEIHKKTDR